MAKNQTSMDSTRNSNANFIVHNIYLKDLSFESPNTPHIFPIEWNPELDFDMQISHVSLEHACVKYS